MERVWWHRLVRGEHSKRERERRRRWEENKSLAKSGRNLREGEEGSAAKENVVTCDGRRGKRRKRWVREQKLSRLAQRWDGAATPVRIWIILREHQRVWTTADLCVKTTDWEFTAAESGKPEESHSWLLRSRHSVTAPLVGHTRAGLSDLTLSSSSWGQRFRPVMLVAASVASTWKFHNHKTSSSLHIS